MLAFDLTLARSFASQSLELLTTHQPFKSKRAAIVTLGMLMRICGQPIWIEKGNASKRKLQGGFDRTQRLAILAQLCLCLRDPDGRIRFAAANALQEIADGMCDADGPIAKDVCGELCLKGGPLTVLIETLRGSATQPPCVIGAAAGAVTAILTESCDSSLLVGHLGDLTAVNLQILGSSSPHIVAQGLTMLSACARIMAGDAVFGRMVSDLMPKVQFLSETHNAMGEGAAAVTVRCAAMACVANLIRAIDIDVVVANVHVLLSPLLKVLAEAMGTPIVESSATSASVAAASFQVSGAEKEDDPFALALSRGALVALRLIIQYLGERILPFSHGFVDSLLMIARRDPQILLTRAADNAQSSEERIVRKIRGEGKLAIEFSSETMRERLQALNTLLSLCQEAPSVVRDKTGEIVGCMVEIVRLPLNAHCQELAADIFPASIRASALWGWTMVGCFTCAKPPWFICYGNRHSRQGIPNFICACRER